MATMAETTGTPALSPSAEPGKAGPTMPAKPLQVDGALCALIDSKASTREIIFCAFFLNAMCWVGLLYSFGAF